MSKQKSGTNPMIDLFCLEAQGQLSVIRDCLAGLKNEPNKSSELQALLRAATSLKGAAKIASLEIVFELAVELENLFSAALQNKLQISEQHLTLLNETVNLVANLVAAADDDLNSWLNKNEPILKTNTQSLKQQIIGTNSETTTASHTVKQTSAGNQSESNNLADFSMLELFRMEADTQIQTMSNCLVELENSPTNKELLETLMRAAHSFKGAARMVGLDSTVKLAHLLEDIFVAAQENKFVINPDDMDIILAAIDMLNHMSNATTKDYQSWLALHQQQHSELLAVLNSILNAQAYTIPGFIAHKAFTVEQSDTSTVQKELNTNSNTSSSATPGSDEKPGAPEHDATVKVSAKRLNRLQGLAGEALVETRWLSPFADSLLQLKKRQIELVALLDKLRDHVYDLNPDEHLAEIMHSTHLKANECRDVLSARLSDLEAYDRRSNSVSQRLNREVLKARMRPFADGVQGFQRMVRDLARSLDKKVNLEIRGLATQVDRDILEKLQAPLNHMIRNAIDHGIETPAERLAAGKPEHGTVRIEAMHNAGMLSIVIQDDGRGVDLEQLRQRIIKRDMVSASMASNLSETELLDFMFLPNFSTRDSVTEFSGRGVGLDVVHSVIQELRGQIRTSTQAGQGIRFQFQLPLTLSVIRALVVNVGGEPYAFPLARIDQTLKINKRHVELMEGRQYFTFGNKHIGLLSGTQVLASRPVPLPEDDIPVVIFGDRIHSYGMVVDKFLGERNLVVHPLDPRLGKVQDVSAASLTEDGNPLLILDVDDLLRSIDILLSGGRIDKLEKENSSTSRSSIAKRILVVDDSITVREVERNLLQSKGYQVEVAVDGMDGWNAARSNHYDLVVSDVDMPRMNGFDFVSMLKNDERFRNLPVIIVSYKDREEDRQRGLEVGADYYLTKGSFHDDSLVEAVIDLIGEPDENL